jgi:hypothetical protein
MTKKIDKAWYLRPLHKIARKSFLIADWQDDPALMLSPHPCTLYSLRRSVIESRQLQRTLLAIFFAVMLSLAFAPHSGIGRGLFRFSGYARGPFFIMPSHIDGKQFVSQTIVIAVVFALIVNIPWRWKKDDKH